MTIKSMTGFARSAGESPPYRWVWELKSVNAKGLDLRLRAPPGFDFIEAEARSRLTARIARGTCFATLSARRDAAAEKVRVNLEAAQAVLAAAESFSSRHALGPLTLDGLLGLRGVVEIVQEEEELSTLAPALLADLDAALDQLLQARRREGEALNKILRGRLRRIGDLVEQAHRAPGRRPEAVRARLARLVEDLAGASTLLDPARLHQEAVLMAAKADVTEEIDRMRVHAAAADELLGSDRPAGRRLDFLAQELAREANTLCAKSGDSALSAIGMDLRVEIEQFREQAQNIE